MRKTAIQLTAACVLAFAINTAAAGINVVVSIKPVHSLVSALMQGTGTPLLIVTGAESPHSDSLKPSQASAIASADVLFWVGPQLETFLQKPLKTIGVQATVITLLDTPGLIKLPPREGGGFAEHTGHNHAAHEVDTHIWLDPQNANILATKIHRALLEADPANAAHYTANLNTVTAKLDQLTAEVKTMLSPVTGKHPIFFHDAYQYFEHRFGITAAGVITVNPHIMPGAGRLADIQAKVKKLGATCVFSEPQFQPKLVQTVIEGSKAKSAVLDPLGSHLPAGPDLYFQLIKEMARSVFTCLR